MSFFHNDLPIIWSLLTLSSIYTISSTLIFSYASGSLIHCCEGPCQFSMGKSVNSVLRTNQIPNTQPPKLTWSITLVTLTKCENFHHNRLNKGALIHTLYMKYNDVDTFFLRYFFSHSRSGRTERRTNMHDGSNDVVRRKLVPFWYLVDMRNKNAIWLLNGKN